MEHFTIYSHWVQDSKIDSDTITKIAVEDFAVKCAHLLLDYQNINHLRFGVAIYDLFNKRWGIDGWYDKGYKRVGKCNSEEERGKYGLYDAIRVALKSNHYPLDLSDKVLHSILGGGEFPFISVLEYHDKDEFKDRYSYVYTINR